MVQEEHIASAAFFDSLVVSVLRRTRTQVLAAVAGLDEDDARQSELRMARVVEPRRFKLSQRLIRQDQRLASRIFAVTSATGHRFFTFDIFECDNALHAQDLLERFGDGREVRLQRHQADIRRVLENPARVAVAGRELHAFDACACCCAAQK